MASTMGAARGRTQGSWRPPAARVTSFPPESTVRCGRRIVEGGLKATRKTIGIPVEMPPSTPPARFVSVATRPPPGDEAVVVLAAEEFGPGEPRADLEALARVDREHRLREVALELVEDGFPEADRDAEQGALDDPADGIAGVPGAPDERRHPRGGALVGAAHRVPVHLGARHPLGDPLRPRGRGPASPRPCTRPRSARRGRPAPPLRRPHAPRSRAPRSGRRRPDPGSRISPRRCSPRAPAGTPFGVPRSPRAAGRGSGRPSRSDVRWCAPRSSRTGSRPGPLRNARW